MRIAAATLVPLLLLGTLELGLRIAGYGYPTAFFVKSRIGEQEFLIPNDKFGYRFFPPALARKPLLQRMAAEKPAGTYRIFLFGESAAFGDPEPSFGVGRYLEALLEQRYPDVEFEVICVAMTAINSHTILPIARECARYDGDLWVIYMGNNEMVGPYGAGTVFGTRAPRRSMVRGILALKTTRVGQLLDRLATGARGDASMPQTWAGIDMFSKNQLRHDDAGRLRAYENFKGNLDDILREGLEAEVPIVLSTVASNLKDCSPFASLHADDLDEHQLSEWNKFYREGEALKAVGAHEAALNAYTHAASIDSEFAEVHFRLGACHQALTNREQALQAFEQARDCDALVVRADTRINRILLDAATRHGPEQVAPVNPAAAFADKDGDGIPGQDLFYDHVHYTLAGNYQLARLLAEASLPMLPVSLTSRGGEGWADAVSCDRRLAVTLWDQQRLCSKQARAISVPPFTSQTTHAESVRHREAQLAEVISSYNSETPEQDRQVYEEALARAPEDCLLRGNYAQFLEGTGLRSQAIMEGQRICELLPDLSWPYYYVGALMVREGRLTEAAAYYRRALEIRSDFVEARNELRMIELGHP